MDESFLYATEMNMYLSGTFLEEAFGRASQMCLPWRERRMYAGSAPPPHFPSFFNAIPRKEPAIVLFCRGTQVYRMLRIYVLVQVKVHRQHHCAVFSRISVVHQRKRALILEHTLYGLCLNGANKIVIPSNSSIQNTSYVRLFRGGLEDLYT